MDSGRRLVQLIVWKWSESQRWVCRDVQRVVRHFLVRSQPFPLALAAAESRRAMKQGDSYRVVEACSKPAWGGAPAGGLHVDSAGNFKTVPPPECPWMINTICALHAFIGHIFRACIPLGHGLPLPPAHRDAARHAAAVSSLVTLARCRSQGC